MVLHYELAHAQQYQWSGAQNVPRWFAEGYAMYVAEDEPAASPADIAWWAIRHGDGAPLQNAFSAASPARPQVRGHERADHALMDYGLSLEAVTLLVKLGQESGISLLLRTLSENVPFAQAFQRTFRMELPEFERLLLAKLRPAYQERAEEPR